MPSFLSICLSLLRLFIRTTTRVQELLIYLHNVVERITAILESQPLEVRTADEPDTSVSMALPSTSTEMGITPSNNDTQTSFESSSISPTTATTESLSSNQTLGVARSLTVTEGANADIEVTTCAPTIGQSEDKTNDHLSIPQRSEAVNKGIEMALKWYSKEPSTSESASKGGDSGDTTTNAIHRESSEKAEIIARLASPTSFSLQPAVSGSGSGNQKNNEAKWMEYRMMLKWYRDDTIASTSIQNVEISDSEESTEVMPLDSATQSENAGDSLGTEKAKSIVQQRHLSEISPATNERVSAETTVQNIPMSTTYIDFISSAHRATDIVDTIVDDSKSNNPSSTRQISAESAKLKTESNSKFQKGANETKEGSPNESNSQTCVTSKNSKSDIALKVKALREVAVKIREPWFTSTKSDYYIDLKFERNLHLREYDTSTIREKSSSTAIRSPVRESSTQTPEIESDVEHKYQCPVRDTDPEGAKLSELLEVSESLGSESTKASEVSSLTAGATPQLLNLSLDTSVSSSGEVQSTIDKSGNYTNSESKLTSRKQTETSSEEVINSHPERKPISESRFQIPQTSTKPVVAGDISLAPEELHPNGESESSTSEEEVHFKPTRERRPTPAASFPNIESSRDSEKTDKGIESEHSLLHRPSEVVTASEVAFTPTRERRLTPAARYFDPDLITSSESVIGSLSKSNVSSSSLPLGISSRLSKSPFKSRPEPRAGTSGRFQVEASPTRTGNMNETRSASGNSSPSQPRSTSNRQRTSPFKSHPEPKLTTDFRFNVQTSPSKNITGACSKHSESLSLSPYLPRETPGSRKRSPFKSPTEQRPNTAVKFEVRSSPTRNENMDSVRSISEQSARSLSSRIVPTEEIAFRPTRERRPTPAARFPTFESTDSEKAGEHPMEPDCASRVQIPTSDVEEELETRSVRRSPATLGSPTDASEREAHFGYRFPPRTTREISPSPRKSDHRSRREDRPSPSVSFQVPESQTKWEQTSIDRVDSKFASRLRKMASELSTSEEERDCAAANERKPKFRKSPSKVVDDSRLKSDSSQFPTHKMPASAKESDKPIRARFPLYDLSTKYDNPKRTPSKSTPESVSSKVFSFKKYLESEPAAENAASSDFRPPTYTSPTKSMGVAESNPTLSLTAFLTSSTTDNEPEFAAQMQTGESSTNDHKGDTTTDSISASSISPKMETSILMRAASVSVSKAGSGLRPRTSESACNIDLNTSSSTDAIRTDSSAEDGFGGDSNPEGTVSCPQRSTTESAANAGDVGLEVETASGTNYTSSDTTRTSLMREPCDDPAPEGAVLCPISATCETPTNAEDVNPEIANEAANDDYSSETDTSSSSSTSESSTNKSSDEDSSPEGAAGVCPQPATSDSSTKGNDAVETRSKTEPASSVPSTTPTTKDGESDSARERVSGYFSHPPICESTHNGKNTQSKSETISSELQRETLTSESTECDTTPETATSTCFQPTACGTPTNFENRSQSESEPILSVTSETKEDLNPQSSIFESEEKSNESISNSTSFSLPVESSTEDTKCDSAPEESRPVSVPLYETDSLSESGQAYLVSYPSDSPSSEEAEGVLAPEAIGPLHLPPILEVATNGTSSDGTYSESELAYSVSFPSEQSASEDEGEYILEPEGQTNGAHAEDMRSESERASVMSGEQSASDSEYACRIEPVAESTPCVRSPISESPTNAESVDGTRSDSETTSSLSLPSEMSNSEEEGQLESASESTQSKTVERLAKSDGSPAHATAISLSSNLQSEMSIEKDQRQEGNEFEIQLKDKSNFEDYPTSQNVIMDLPYNPQFAESNHHISDSISQSSELLVNIKEIEMDSSETIDRIICQTSSENSAEYLPVETEAVEAQSFTEYAMNIESFIASEIDSFSPQLVVGDVSTSEENSLKNGQGCEKSILESFIDEAAPGFEENTHCLHDASNSLCEKDIDGLDSQKSQSLDTDVSITAEQIDSGNNEVSSQLLNDSVEVNVNITSENAADLVKPIVSDIHSCIGNGELIENCASNRISIESLIDIKPNAIHAEDIFSVTSQFTISDTSTADNVETSNGQCVEIYRDSESPIIKPTKLIYGTDSENPTSQAITSDITLVAETKNNSIASDSSAQNNKISVDNAYCENYLEATQPTIHDLAPVCEHSETDDGSELSSETIGLSANVSYTRVDDNSASVDPISSESHKDLLVDVEQSKNSNDVVASPSIFGFVRTSDKNSEICNASESLNDESKEGFSAETDVGLYSETSEALVSPIPTKSDKIIPSSDSEISIGTDIHIIDVPSLNYEEPHNNHLDTTPENVQSVMNKAIYCKASQLISDIPTSAENEMVPSSYSEVRIRSEFPAADDQSSKSGELQNYHLAELTFTNVPASLILDETIKDCLSSQMPMAPQSSICKDITDADGGVTYIRPHSEGLIAAESLISDNPPTRDHAEVDDGPNFEEHIASESLICDNPPTTDHAEVDDGPNFEEHISPESLVTVVSPNTNDLSGTNKCDAYESHICSAPTITIVTENDDCPDFQRSVDLVITACDLPIGTEHITADGLSSERYIVPESVIIYDTASTVIHSEIDVSGETELTASQSVLIDSLSRRVSYTRTPLVSESNICNVATTAQNKVSDDEQNSKESPSALQLCDIPTSAQDRASKMYVPSETLTCATPSSAEEINDGIDHSVSHVSEVSILAHYDQSNDVSETVIETAEGNEEASGTNVDNKPWKKKSRKPKKKRKH